MEDENLRSNKSGDDLDDQVRVKRLEIVFSSPSQQPLSDMEARIK